MSEVAARAGRMTPTGHARITLPGPVGRIEVWLGQPAHARGIALIAHPHPLLGGHPQHKVPAILASRLCEEGYLCARPAFRGVANSEGEHDSGRGEAVDLKAVAQHLLDRQPHLPLFLIGFSFGAFVQTRVAKLLAEAGVRPHALVLAGTAIGEVADRTYAPEAIENEALVVHGENDEAVPLERVVRWAEGRVPVVVIPGADHSFSGRLPMLGDVVCRHIRAVCDGEGK